MNIDYNYIEELKSIPWFEYCGLPLDTNINQETTSVSTWNEAEKYFLEPTWDDTELEIKNELTMYLNDRHQNLYQFWNKLVNEAKPFIETIVVPRATKVLERNRLNTVFLDCVKWDVLLCIMYASYKNYHPPKFTECISTIYQRGHFPCGWQGLWPEGKLLVY